jgi:hypothetical protein
MTVDEIKSMFPEDNLRGPVTMSDLQLILVKMGSDYVAPSEGSESGSGSSSAQ